MLTPRRVLAVGAHTDDIELGCGGLLHRLARSGTAISVAAFSVAEGSLPQGMPDDTLEREFRTAMTLLPTPVDIHLSRYPVRRLADHRQDILETLVAINRTLAPDLVLTMNSADTHQDHAVVHAESVRAFRGTTVLGYETPWNQHTSRVDVFAELDPQDLEAKIAMLQCYQSQVALKRPYVDPDFPRSAATFRGFQGRLPLAEVYEVLTMRWELP